MRALKRIDAAMQRFAWLPRWTLIVAGVICMYWAADRAAPSGVISVDPAYARPGEFVTIRYSMWKDADRDCHLRVSRSLFDARNDKADYPSVSFSDEALARIERDTPGRRSVTVAIPDTAAAGPAVLVSSLEYECNRMHALWPIRVTTVLPFTILP